MSADYGGSFPPPLDVGRSLLARAQRNARGESPAAGAINPTSSALAELGEALHALSRFAGPAIAAPLLQRLDPIHDELNAVATARFTVASQRLELDAAADLVAAMHNVALKVADPSGRYQGAPMRGVLADVEHVALRCVAAEEALSNSLRGESPEVAGLVAEIDHLHATMRRWRELGAVHNDTVNKAIRRAQAAGAKAKKEA